MGLRQVMLLCVTAGYRATAGAAAEKLWASSFSDGFGNNLAKRVVSVPSVLKRALPRVATLLKLSFPFG